MVDLGDNVEGFVPTSQLGARDLTDPTGIFKEGEQLPLQVIEFDQNQHKVVLSVIAYYKKRERDEFDKYLNAHTTESVSAMADAMPEEIKAEADAAKAEPAADKPEKTAEVAPEQPTAKQPTAEQPTTEQPAAEEKPPADDSEAKEE